MLSLWQNGKQASRLATLNVVHRRNFSDATGNGVLLIAEHNNKKIQSGTFNTISAATLLKAGKISVLLAGHFEGDVSKALAKELSEIEGVNQVLIANKEQFKHGLAENFATLIKNCQSHYKTNYVLAPATSFGKNVLPRVAGMLGVSQVSDITAIKSPDTFVRPIYAGNALATVKSKDSVKLITVRATSFDKAKQGTANAEVINVPDNLLGEAFSGTKWLNDEVKVSERPELGGAKVVISGGRGIKSKENFKILEELADSMGAALGASRAAVDAGFAPNDWQVGQTGKIVAPEVYIAVGISGAIQHLAGMKDSKVIVAINKDAEAPIFQVADYGIVTDLFTAVPEMTRLMKKGKEPQ